MNDNKIKKNVLFHEIGKESRIVIKESGNIDESDFFYTQYKQAADIVKSYCNKRNSDCSFENLNNIVAFIGERGSGKTSCMMTFANCLEPQTVGGKSIFSLAGINDNTSTKEPSKFEILPVIDPSFFSKNYNIVGAFLANIYDSYKQLRERPSKSFDCNLGKVNDFLVALSKAQHSFSVLNADPKSSGDSIEELEGLSCTLRLKEEIYQLCKKYLGLLDKSENDSYLVLCIDDIDLNTSSAVEMLEWIRKYLIQPNIIVLMALKLDQMTNLKRMSLYTEYANLVEKGRMEEYEVEEMAERYMSKLFPLANRVYLPDQSTIPLVTYNSDRESEYNYDTLQDAVVKLIYDKTRFLFYNSPQRSSLIVPRNLREALHLMRMLYDMEDLPGKKYSTQRTKILFKNQSLFKEYLYYDFMVRNLTSKSRNYIEELLTISDATQFNAEVLQVLRKKFDDILDKYVREDKNTNNGIQEAELANIFNQTNIVHNISMGDILWVLDWLDNMERTDEETYFLFVVRTMCSMRLFEYYDQLVSEENKKRGTAVSHLRKEISEKDNYHLLLGGQVFNPQLVDFFPEKKDTFVKLSDLRVDLKKLKDLFIKEEGGEADYFSKNVKFLELVMLCISRPTERKFANDSEYRKNTSPRYAVHFTKNSRYAIFDALSFFYNVTDIKGCYERFRDVFGHVMDTKECYFIDKIINDNKNTLWSELYRASINSTVTDKEGKLHNLREVEIPSQDHILNYKNDANESDRNLVLGQNNRELMSWVCVRNAEAYQILSNYLEGFRRNSETENLMESIKNFFKTVCGFKLGTYKDIQGKKRNSESTALDINCNYAYIVWNLLRNAQAIVDGYDNENSVIVSRYFCQ